MKALSILLIIAVSVLNVALNLCLKKTAALPGGFTQLLLSRPFLGSFAVGMASFLSLFALYSTGITLSRGILMMGAISILGGGLYGVVLYDETLHVSEWIIFSLLTILLAYRWFFKV